MEYRLNYGNGQVSGTFTAYKAARRALEAQRGELYCEAIRIQRYAGDGEWESIGKAGRLATANREGL